MKFSVCNEILPYDCGILRVQLFGISSDLGVNRFEAITGLRASLENEKNKFASSGKHQPVYLKLGLFYMRHRALIFS